MSFAERAFKVCSEHAEMEYLRAKERGLTDPVVELMALDPEDPSRVDVSVRERADIVRALTGKCQGAADALGQPQTDGKPLRIVVTTPEGVTYFEKSLTA